NDSRQFLARFDWGVTRLVAKIEQFFEPCDKSGWSAARAQMLIDDRLGNRGGRQIEPLADLFLQQVEQRAEELVRLVFGSEFVKLGDSIADDERRHALASQARVVGESLRSFAPHQSA